MGNSNKKIYDELNDKLNSPGLSMNITLVYAKICRAYLFSNFDNLKDHVKIVSSIIDTCNKIDKNHSVRIKILEYGTLFYNLDYINESSLFEYLNQEPYDEEYINKLTGYYSCTSLDGCLENFGISINLSISFKSENCEQEKNYVLFTISTESLEYQVYIDNLFTKLKIMDKFVNDIDKKMSVKYQNLSEFYIPKMINILSKIKNNIILKEKETEIVIKILYHNCFIITCDLLNKDNSIIRKTPYKEYIVAFLTYIIYNPMPVLVRSDDKTDYVKKVIEFEKMTLDNY